MAKAGKNGLNYASGLEAYIYSIAKFNKAIINGVINADKQYMISISVDDHTGFMIFEYDKTQISFDDIGKLAEEIAPEYGKYIEVSGNNKLDYDSEHYWPVYRMKVKYIGPTCVSLINNKEYEVLSIENGCYRIIDETEEDYLFMAEEFVVTEK